jgi:hypothetical protein
VEPDAGAALKYVHWAEPEAQVNPYSRNAGVCLGQNRTSSERIPHKLYLLGIMFRKSYIFEV